MESSSPNGVFRRLGLRVGGSQWLVLRSLIQARGWSTEHWIRPLSTDDPDEARGEFRDALAGADLEALVAVSRSRADIIRGLGFTPSSTTYRILRTTLRERNVATEFDSSHVAMRQAARPRYRTALSEVLVKNSTYANMTVLKERLVAEGLMHPACSICGIDTWNGPPLVLHLDHINGVRDDHRLENLRLLCPNCHSQTQTFAGRNRGRYARPGVADREGRVR